jgi:hypothetical protein
MISVLIQQINRNFIIKYSKVYYHGLNMLTVEVVSPPLTVKTWQEVVGYSSYPCVTLPKT